MSPGCLLFICIKKSGDQLEKIPFFSLIPASVFGLSFCRGIKPIWEYFLEASYNSEMLRNRIMLLECRGISPCIISPCFVLYRHAYIVVYLHTCVELYLYVFYIWRYVYRHISWYIARCYRHVLYFAPHIMLYIIIYTVSYSHISCYIAIYHVMSLYIMLCRYILCYISIIYGYINAIILV